ncbi:MAG: molybdopterin-guanine dinucleotide biosynthesis protein MobA [Frankiaceae bacterium]|nr:molybdopterin-guanine dinucleotide biosynthesis protein MobA [Frankiaceae bacterium]
MTTLDDWVAAVVADLDLQTGVDVTQVLDLARDVAHGVERPAAPVTTWLAGMAVAAGADPAEVVDRIRALAATWQQ